MRKRNRELTPTMMRALKKMKRYNVVSAFELGESLSTLEALERRGKAIRYPTTGSLFDPQVGILWRAEVGNDV